MDWDTVISIIKWIGLAFAAGLIGYFGKFLGQRIISRFSKNKENSRRQEPPPLQSPTSTEKFNYKLEKKQLKQERKTEKKQQKKTDS